MATVVSTLPILPLALQAVGGDPVQTYNAVDLRYLIRAAYPRAGVIADATGFLIQPNQAGANWSVDVNPGQAIVTGNTVNEKFLVTNNTRTNIPLTGFNTAPTATRTHAVWLAVDDKNVAPGANYASRVVLTEDTGTGAPNPNYPFFFKLATFSIASGQSNIATANIVNLFARGDRKTAVGTLTLVSGFTALAGGQAPSWSISGNTVTLQGAVTITTPLAANAGAVNFVTTLSSSLWPTVLRYFPVIATNGGNTGRLVVSSSGILSITPSPFNTTTLSSFSLDGINYEIN